MAPRGSNTRRTAAAAARVTKWSIPLRQKLMRMGSDGEELGITPRRHSTGYRPDQNLRQNVYDDRYQKQRQADFHQRTEVGIGGCFAELVGDHTRHGISGGK